mmetsp:Transcript_139898/g.389923  ORF Transcript_139898/g.389923 Transcript_139898/m.389923 type:complete len:207 (-) Transcript_139898:1124-1744(-)
MPNDIWSGEERPGIFLHETHEEQVVGALGRTSQVEALTSGVQISNVAQQQALRLVLGLGEGHLSICPVQQRRSVGARDGRPRGEADRRGRRRRALERRGPVPEPLHHSFGVRGDGVLPGARQAGRLDDGPRHFGPLAQAHRVSKGQVAPGLRPSRSAGTCRSVSAEDLLALPEVQHPGVEVHQAADPWVLHALSVWKVDQGGMRCK